MSDASKHKQVGNYFLGKTLGQGTFGKVKLGLHTQTGEKVAVKILDKQMIEKQGDVERVNREIAILRKVRHPNIVQLYEILETDQKLYLIMQYAAGGELFEYIVAQKKISEIEAGKYLQQLISGIEYIHKMGIVHRDLKPENLLFDQHQNLIIVDFGLSNIYKPNTLLKTACGSPCYAAPEMIKGEPYNGLMTDIWSCGIIFYAIICGFLPFDDQNTQSLYRKIISGSYVLPPFLSKEAKVLVQGLLNTSPSLRFNIEQIRNTQYYLRFVRNVEPRGVILGLDSIQVDEAHLELISQQMNIQDKEQIKFQIQQNKHNQITTYYYLLKQKLAHESKNSQIRVKRSISNQPQTGQSEEQTQTLLKQREVMNEKQKMKFKIFSPQKILYLSNFSTQTSTQASTQRPYAKFSPIFTKQRQIFNSSFAQTNKNIKNQEDSQKKSYQETRLHPARSSYDHHFTTQEFKKKELFESQFDTNKPQGKNENSQPKNEGKQKRNQIQRTSYAKSQHNPQIEVQRSHPNHINFNCIVLKQPIEVITALMKASKSLAYNIKIVNYQSQTGKYNIQFQKKNLIFDIEIQNMGNSQYLQFKRKSGLQHMYTQETQQLLKLAQA